MFEIEENKVNLFFASEVVYARYDLFVILLFESGCPLSSRNKKMIITH